MTTRQTLRPRSSFDAKHVHEQHIGKTRLVGSTTQNESNEIGGVCKDKRSRIDSGVCTGACAESPVLEVGMAHKPVLENHGPQLGVDSLPQEVNAKCQAINQQSGPIVYSTRKHGIQEMGEAESGKRPDLGRTRIGREGRSCMCLCLRLTGSLSHGEVCSYCIENDNKAIPQQWFSRTVIR